MIKRLLLVILIIIGFAWAFSELAEHTGLPIPPGNGDDACQSLLDTECTPALGR